MAVEVVVRVLSPPGVTYDEEGNGWQPRDSVLGRSRISLLPPGRARAAEEDEWEMDFCYGPEASDQVRHTDGRILAL